LERGPKMSVMSVVKVAVLAGMVALPASFSVASAKAMKLPPGACAFEKSAVANSAFCSFSCDATGWCSQQLCTNGVLTKVIPCYGTFCSAKCGG
jgi:hypothetical protein